MRKFRSTCDCRKSKLVYFNFNTNMQYICNLSMWSETSGWETNKNFQGFLPTAIRCCRPFISYLCCAFFVFEWRDKKIRLFQLICMLSKTANLLIAKPWFQSVFWWLLLFVFVVLVLDFWKYKLKIWLLFLP
jgi:hypothetical protein